MLKLIFKGVFDNQSFLLIIRHLSKRNMLCCIYIKCIEVKEMVLPVDEEVTLDVICLSQE